MISINKERIVALVAVVVAIYGIATAFSGERISGTVPDVPPPGPERKPTMNLVRAQFLNKPFSDYWGDDNNRDPWVMRKTTSNPTPNEIPMPEPQLSTGARVVPAPPFAPRQDRRLLIRQLKPPVSVEENPQPGTGDTGSEEDEG